MGKTYSLLLENEQNSDTYYNEISEISMKVANMLNIQGKEYVDEYIEFIRTNNIEILRSFNEYGIELLLIGVLFIEYIDNARAFKYVIKAPFNYLNNLRMKKVRKGKSYKRIDKLRGRLINKFLLRKVDGQIYPTFEGFILLIKWLRATNDYNEELIRLSNWIKFFNTKNNRYVQGVLINGINMAEELYNIGEKYLWKYTKHVFAFNEKQKSQKTNREDTIFRTKTEIQYYFNMTCAEIMNMQYKDDYKNCEQKLLFVPSCLRQTKSECQSTFTLKGMKCTACAKACNVNKITKKAKEFGIIAYIIPHESSMFKYINHERKKGLIGVACVLNLMSGGWKALRIGYIPQCVLIDSPGCSTHWLEKEVMTSINMERIVIQ